jgi:hypothetical protein
LAALSLTEFIWMRETFICFDLRWTGVLPL